MEINDSNFTVGLLKKEVIAMCVRKGWGDNGIQHPQHVAMAMMVELMELMEHFVGVPESRLDERFADPSELAETAEEAADVLMYALQIMHTIRCDVSAGLNPAFSDETTPISALRRHVGKCGVNASEQVMRLATVARFVLEEFQWMNEDEVQLMIKGGLPEKRAAIGSAFANMLREMLLLADRLDFDVAGAIMRKIGVVDKRVYPDSEPDR